MPSTLVRGLRALALCGKRLPPASCTSPLGLAPQTPNLMWLTCEMSVVMAPLCQMADIRRLVLCALVKVLCLGCAKTLLYKLVDEGAQVGGEGGGGDIQLISEIAS